MTITDPIIGSRYQDVENNLKFKVVAIEETDDAIEVQYFNGDIGEYDHDNWYNSKFNYIEVPEDWREPFDDIATDPFDDIIGDDLAYTDKVIHAHAHKHKSIPIIDSWYKDIESDLEFKVVAIEGNDDLIEVQYVNGDIGEYDKEGWYNSTFDYIDEPVDWTEPFDDTSEHLPNPEDEYMHIEDYLD